MTAARKTPARKPASKPAASTSAAPRKRGRPSNAEKAAALAAAAEPKVKPTIVNRYDAAGMGRRMRGWNPPSSGPNKALEGLSKLRDRARDSVRNDWSGTSGLQHWTTNLIGTGIVPRITRLKNLERKIELIDLWNRWSRQCDANGVLDFYGLQTLATRAWLESGEVFVRLRPRRPDFGMEVPLQIELIEADYVPMLDADNWPGMQQGNKIRSGIEFDRSNQKVAYWVYKSHPRDGQAPTQNDLIRVTTSRMLHCFEPKRVGQLRGVPDSAPVLAHLREVADYDGNVRQRMSISNLFAGFIRRPGVSGVDDGVDPLTGNPIVSDGSGGAMVSLEPATMHELMPGEDITFANPPEPGTVYGDYMRVQNQGTAAGWGLPYELLTGDIKEVSDRTLRVIINEFRRFAEQRQHQIIIPQICQPIRAMFAQQALLAALITSAELSAVIEVTWQPQAWPYIHPVQDVQAKETEVNARFRSRSSVQAERGEDPELVDQEIADDMERAERLGINPVTPAATGKPGANPDPNNPDGDGIAPGEYPRNRALDNLTATVARLETRVTNADQPDPTLGALVALITAQQEQMAGLMSSVTALAQSLAARPLEVRNEVAAPAVSVTNEVPAPVVNVAAPAVSVTNEVPAPVVNVTNDVKPADVVVDVNLPERETTSLIERDSSGNIKSVTQTERTIN